MSKIEKAMSRMSSSTPRTEDRAVARKRAPGASMPTRFDPELGRMGQPRLWTAAERARLGILDFRTPGAPGTDIFRQLRVAIAERMDRRNMVIGVTGVTRRAGASFVSANLAVAFALDRGGSAMLIDCETQDQSASRLRIVDTTESSAPGLSEYLFNDGVDEGEIIRPTGWPRLRVVPLGSVDNQEETFTAPRLPGLFEHLSQRYSDRTILVDMPPVGAIADARIIGQLCDAVVLVVPYGRVTAEEVDEAIDRVGPERLIGTVFNNEPAIFQ